MSDATKPADRRAATPLAALMPDAAKIHRLSAVLTLLLLVAGFSLASQAFFSVNNGLTILLQTSVIGLLGIGMTMVIITGGIDLSVGSVLGFTGMTVAVLQADGIGGGAPWGWPLSVLAGVLIGAAIGFYAQNEIERDYKDKQLAAYEEYLERRAKAKK